MTLLAATANDNFLREFAETRRYLAGRPTNAQFTADSKSVLFLRSSPKDPRQLLYELDVASCQSRELLTPESLLQGASETLSVEEKARLERMRVTARGFTSYQLSRDGSKVLVVLSGKLYVYERAGGKVTQLKTGEGAAIDPKFSPDGASVAYVRANDVQVIDLKKNVEHAATKGGTALKPNGLAEFVAQEEMDRFSGFWFSPDSKRIAFQASDHTGVEQLQVSDPMHPEAEADHFYYPRAGKANVATRLGLTAVGGGAVTWVQWDAKEYPYLATVRWPAKGPLTVLVQNRAQTAEQLLSVDDKTGRTTVLLKEADAAWLNLAQAFPHWLPDGSGFFWLSEREGGPQLELHQADGSLKSVWLKPEAGWAKTNDSLAYDEANRTLYFAGGPNPTAAPLWKVREGEAPQLVKTDFSDQVTSWVKVSGDGQYFLQWGTALGAMPRTAVFRADGTKVADLPSVAVEPTLKLGVETKKVGDGPGFWTMVFKPEGFKPNVKLPVILSVYGGPGHQQVTLGHREHLIDQWLANQGFIVVKVDGRGTPRRGRDFERAIKGDFATHIAEDQLAGLKAVAKTVPEMDLSRVGVYGWSFGGYLTGLLTLGYGDQVKSGVAGAPVVDWHDYDTHYTERYLGVPPADDKAYEVSSLLTYVPKSKRPLLVIHGTADDNVYFLHTLKLSDAMFRAGKPHQVLPLSNFTHMVPDPLVTERLYERIAQFFKETL
ncbi:MAG: DPP IV N-terminal domain-containing protein [Archangiaceae bacterium]|nr:DPP IV N-terminal domain-containing protein [Archangiaceae bacterium]